MAADPVRIKEGEDYGKNLERFFERQDGKAGYLHGFNYAKRFSRWNPERVQFLPLIDSERCDDE